MPTTLIISNSRDVHADEIENGLKLTGAIAVRLNTDRFVSDKIELVFRDCGIDQGISVNGKWLSFKEITSVVYRRPELPETVVTDIYQKEFAEKEAEEFIKQLYFYLDDALWVSRHDCLERARRKLNQLQVAKQYGMIVPKTLATNSPERVRIFYEEREGLIIYKTLRVPVIRMNEEQDFWSVPTTLLSQEQMEKIDLIQHTGGIFKEYIEKEYEIRVTVIGREVFATKIDSQANSDSRVDWRDAVVRGIIQVTPYVLPENIANQCRNITKSYGLNFSAIDLIKTPCGKYYFLEINCNGQWLWIEELTGQKLLNSFVQLLVSGKNSGLT